MKRYTVLIVVTSFLLAGCAAIPSLDGPSLEIPNQGLGSSRIDSMTRVVFFNNTNRLLWPTSHVIRLSLDGKVAPAIPSGKYLQVDLEPGTYELVLRHRDVVLFTHSYSFTVEGRDQYVRLYNVPLRSEYEVVDSLPNDFDKKYEALSVKQQGR